jgi:serine/threonine protein kinase
MSRNSLLNPTPPIASNPASQYLFPATFFANISFPQPYHGSLLKGCSASWLNALQVTMEKAPLVPTVISHYKILSKLGEGGMGVVYKAQDTKLDRVFEWKFFSTEALWLRRKSLP